MGEPVRALNVITGPWAKQAPSLRDRTIDVFSRVLPARWDGFSAREGQTTLTSAIADTIAQGGVLLAEGPCFTPGALVRVNGAYRPIETVGLGDAIETMHGPAAIVRTLRREYEGDVITLGTNSGFAPVTTTDTHRFPVLRRRRCVEPSRANTLCSPDCNTRCPVRGREPHADYAIETVEARDLGLDDCLLFRQPRERFGLRTENPHYLEMLGYWIAEGHTTEAKCGGPRLMFTLHAKERGTIGARIATCAHELGTHATVRVKGENCIRVYVSARELALRATADCGSKSHGKHLPAWFGDLSREQQIILLTALFRGDAYIRTAEKARGSRDSQTLRYVTVSEALARGVRDALLGLGVRCSCITEAARVDGKGVSHRVAYRVLVPRRFMGMFGAPVETIRQDLKQVEHAEGGEVYTLLPIRSLARSHYAGPVYSLTSSGDDSYLTDVGTSKNCGTGKGLAYLVPAVLEADRTGKTVVVVTASIALQEQLIQKDLPALATALAGELRTPLTFALLKGRSNYICLNTLADPPPAYLSHEESAELRAVDQWARTTDTGDRLELPMIVRDGTWALRSTTTDDCLRDGCDYYDDCFARAAKARAEGVRVLVINYHLLFAHIAVRAETGADMVIPKTAGFDSKLAWDTVLCDEAHEAGDIAREFLGCAMSEGMVRKVASWLRDDAKACEDDEPITLRLDLAAAIEREAAALWRGMVDRVPRPLTLKGQPKEGDRTQRLREGLPAEDLHDLVVRAGKVASALHASLAKHGAELEKDDRKVMRRAENCARRARRIASWLDASVCPAEAPQAVMWIEVREVGKRREERATLHGRLLDVGSVLRDELFGRSRAVVLTSATLTTGGTPRLGAVLPAETSDSWSWARAQVGLPGSTPALAVASPFDFAAQSVLCLPSGRSALPGPKDHREAFDAAVCGVMARVARAAGGRTLGLFTSRRMAERAAAHLRTLGLPWPVLCQGEQPRPLLLAAMRAQPSILCGTASLWTGVDLPGESVVAVVIDKLPFTPPDDPVMQALGELAAYRTGDRMAGFTQESLPRATLEVRQGAGRLIRSDRDWGAVVLCDSRLTTARYGRGVVASLGMPAQVHSVEALEAWFRARAQVQTGGAR